MRTRIQLTFLLYKVTTMDLEKDFLLRIDKNNEYYNSFYKQLQNRTEKRNYSELFEIFTKHLGISGTILDIGCGTGLHLKKFKEMGYDAIGIEPSIGLKEICEEQNLNVFEGTFENINSIKLPEKISGLWCAASLLHIPKEQLRNILKNLRQLVEVNIPIFITLRIGDGAFNDSYDSSTNEVVRFIQLYPINLIIEELKKSNFKIVYKRVEDSYWGRPVEWLSLVAVSK
jgi:SAM-dependent methyltransferase